MRFYLSNRYKKKLKKWTTVGTVHGSIIFSSNFFQLYSYIHFSFELDKTLVPIRASLLTSWTIKGKLSIYPSLFFNPFKWNNSYIRELQSVITNSSILFSDHNSLSLQPALTLWNNQITDTSISSYLLVSILSIYRLTHLKSPNS